MNADHEYTILRHTDKLAKISAAYKGRTFEANIWWPSSMPNALILDSTAFEYFEDYIVVSIHQYGFKSKHVMRPVAKADRKIYVSIMHEDGRLVLRNVMEHVGDNNIKILCAEEDKVYLKSQLFDIFRDSLQRASVNMSFKSITVLDVGPFDNCEMSYQNSISYPIDCYMWLNRIANLLGPGKVYFRLCIGL